MKQLFLLFTVVILFFTIGQAEAQLKPAQAQYIPDKTALVNPGFEQGYTGWGITGGCTKSLVSSVPFLGKTLRLTCVSATFSVKQIVTELSPLSGQQAAFDVQVKSDASGVKVSSISNSVRDVEYSVVGDSTYKRFKRIGVIADAVNNGLEIYSDAAFTGVVDIDNTYLGLSNLIEEVAVQAGNEWKSLTTNGTDTIWEVSERLNDKIKNNLIVNPSYERGLIGSDDNGDLVIVHAGGFDASGRDPRTLQGSTHNFFALNIESIVAGNSFELTKSTAQDFTGRQMVAYCEIRTTRDDVYFQAYPNGTDLLTEVKVSNSGTWDYYRIPFVGENSPSLKVTSKGNVLLDSTKVDNCFLGVSDNETQKIQGAHFVGSMNFYNSATNDLDCREVSASTSFILPDLAGCDSLGVFKNIVPAIDTTRPSFKMNVIAGNTYKISVNDFIYRFNSVTNCETGISLDGGLTVEVLRRHNGNDTVNYEQTQSGSTYEFEATATGEIVVQYRTRNSVASQCEFMTRLGDVKLSVYAFPDSKSTIATQDVELTAKTANVNVINFQPNGVIASQDYTGVVTLAADEGVGVYRFDISPDFVPFSVTGCQVDTTSDSTCNYNYVDADTIKIIIQNGAGGFEDRFGNFTISKNNVNKSQTIVGTFEQIENVTADLDASTANDFNVRVSDAGVVSQENYDFINGNCANPSAGVYNCTPILGIFTENVNALAVAYRTTTASRRCMVTTATSTLFQVSCQTAGTTTPVNVGFHLTVSKTGADYRKSYVGAIINASTAQDEIVQAVLENTASDDLTMIEMQGGGADVVTASSTPIPFTVISSSDTKSEWDGNTFAPKSKGQFSFDGLMTFTSLATRFVSIVQTGSKNITYLCSENTTSTDDKVGIHCVLNMEIGDTAEIRSSGAGGTLKTNPELRYLKITQSATKESIVANLMQGQTTKCQTKYLSANVTSNGVVAGLGYSGLKVGSIYKLYHNSRCVFTGSGVDNLGVNYQNGISFIDRTVCSGTSAGQSVSSSIAHIFKATDTTLTATAESIGAGTYIFGDGSATKSTLCEEPDTTIFTTEFN